MEKRNKNKEIEKSQEDDDVETIELDSEIVGKFTSEIDAAITKVLKTIPKDAEGDGFFELISVLLSIASSIMIDTGGKKKDFVNLSRDIYQSIKEYMDTSFEENKKKNKELNIKDKNLN